MLVPIRTLPHEHLITRPEPPAILMVHKGLSIGLGVVEIAEDNGGGLNEELAALLILVDLVAIEVDNLGCRPWDKVAGGARDNVELGGHGDEG